MSLKILLTGTTTSGKTTLVERLKTHELGKIAYVEEEARKFLSENPGAEQDPDLQNKLFRRQVTAELTAGETAEILICDRGVPDNIAHALLFGQDIKDEWKVWSQTYDYIFVLNSADIDYQQPTELQMSIDPHRDWKQFRQNLDDHILLALQECGLSYALLSGSVEERLVSLEGIINSHSAERR